MKHVLGELVPRNPEGVRLLEKIEQRLGSIAEGAPRHDREGSFPYETFARMTADGVLAGTVPGELGGGDVDTVHDVAVVINRVARADASTALALHMQLSRGLTLAHEWRSGAEPMAQRAEGLLRGMATGTAVICGAVAECGRDYAHVETELARTPTGWVLNGRKTFCTLAPLATHFVVRCRTRGATGSGNHRIASAVVPRNAPGVTVADNWDALGMRASGSPDVVFSGCPVADNAVDLRSPWGVFQPRELLGRTVSSIAMLGIYVGIAEAARDIALRSLMNESTSRSLPQVIAAVETHLMSMQATLERSLLEVDRVARLDGDVQQLGLAAMGTFQRAKLLINTSSVKLVDWCMTLVGSAAYASRHPLSRLYRDVRAGSYMQPYSPGDAAEYIRRVSLGLDTSGLARSIE